MGKGRVQYRMGKSRKKLEELVVIICKILPMRKVSSVHCHFKNHIFVRFTEGSL